MLTIEIDTSNAAFEDDQLHSELEACVRRVMYALDRGKTAGAIMDTNGNTVGRFALTEE